MHSRRRDPTLAAVVALSFTVLLSVFDMGGWDPTQFLRVGAQAASREFVQADIPDTHLAPGWGHDGQANYVLAAVFPDLADAAGNVDSATYRARRIVYPALVSWIPRGMPLVVGMWVLNLAAVAGTAVVVAELARRHGAHWFAGAIVGATPGFVASVVVDLGDALALFLAGAGVWAWRRERSTTLAVGLFVLAALTRETSLVIPAAVFLVEGGRRRAALLVPPAAIAAWIVILQLWIGGPGKSAAQFQPPFGGWLDPGAEVRHVAIAAVLLVGSLWVGHRLWSIDRVWAVVILLDALVLVCVDRAVLFNTLNLTRVTPWVIPLAVIAVTAHTSSVPDADVDPARDAVTAAI